MKTLTIPIFDVCIYLAKDREDAKEFIREKCGTNGDEKVVDSPRGLCYSAPDVNGTGDYHMLCVFDADVHIIVHECVHMAWMTLKRVRVPVTQTNDEMLAYLAGYLVAEVYKYLEIEIPGRI